eukprot:CAMPEP_0201489392 /NCGR_PEP_ID=MMETSP0151_2-20130828/22630_1 /ASSEMBLY_ACC=CAM_ASM_000257 /TAXON_ID=200890 /ORGANISM="Paramoeba atlantica, Strain 621/1 / CCAP 1560/9" /LENGTH=407 /DNA_ID=CAMNT_0047874979 /DNA_START=95 /DNA_END=1318 /DNA_ORIENTATION=+
MWVLFVSLFLFFGQIRGELANFEEERLDRHVHLDKDPDCFRNISEMISSKGYPVNFYEVQTEDGYILGMYNIPYGSGGPTTGPRQPVLLQHGLVDSCFSWVLNLPSQALTYILADAGYDVWLGNNRGTVDSRKHIKYTTHDKEFWDFSYDQFAQYDVPAFLSFIMSKTGYNKVSYVGHSQGTLQMFAALSESNNMARDHINLFAALGPVITVGNLESHAIVLLANKHVPDALYLFGIYQFPGPTTECMGNLFSSLCYECAECCSSIIETICGRHRGAFNESRMDVMGAHEPGDTSTININHWAQGVRTGQFQKYNFGPVYNEKFYGQKEPPLYNMSNIPTTIPIALFSGSKDKLADPLDVQYLAGQIPGGPVQWKIIEPYAHLDFVWATDANVEVYDDILNLLATYT